MEIDRLDDNRILITFEREEFDFLLKDRKLKNLDNEYSPHLFFGMITLAAVKSGISLSGKRMTVHYLTGSCHNFIIITVNPQKCLPTVRSVWLCASFSDYFTMTEAIPRIDLDDSDKVFHSELLSMWKTPVLLLSVDSNAAKKFKNTLSEYSTVQVCSAMDVARLKEYGNILAADSAMLSLFKSL